jgi:arylformamidase
MFWSPVRYPSLDPHEKGSFSKAQPPTTTHANRQTIPTIRLMDQSFIVTTRTSGEPAGLTLRLARRAARPCFAADPRAPAGSFDARPAGRDTLSVPKGFDGGMMALYRGFSTQAEIDDEYDPERRVDDPKAFEKVIAGRVALSEAARAELSGVLDQHYGPTLKERLDIYPARKQGAPIAVFIHGGYWYDWRLTKDKYIWVATAFARRDITTVVIDYDICPRVTIDEITRQCRAAIAWVWHNAARFGGDPGRIYVTGNSAGGHLTAMIAVTDWVGEYGLPADVVKGGCPISGLYDLDPFPYSWLQPKLQLDWAQVRRNSPLAHVRPGLPPLLISLGGDESGEFHRQSEAFHDSWLAHGNSSRLMPQPGRNHWTALAGFGDPDSEFFRAVFAHMEQSFAPRPAGAMLPPPADRNNQ